MSKIMNDNFKINVGNPIDSRYLASTNLPYTSVSAVNTAIVQSQRYVGLTVNINNVEYWYESGVLDGNLVIKDSGIASTGVTNAYNGITKEGNAVKLGGTLTGATVFTKSGTGSLLKYAGDYSNEFDAQTLVDAEYVTGLTSQSIATSSNGLTKVGQNVELGGTTPLSKVTNICGAGNNMNIGTAASKIGVLNLNANSVAILSTGTTEICPTGTLTLDGSAISVKEVASYDTDKSGSYTLRSIPDVAYITGITSAIETEIAEGITGATNGLTKVGQDVCLGGDLSGNTNINLNGHGINFDGDGTGNDYFGVGYNINAVGDFGIYANYIGLYGSEEARIGINDGSNGGGELLITPTSNTFRDRKTNGSGLEYSQDYSANYNVRSLVDKNYVDTEINGLTGVTSQAITGATNGLTKTGQDIVLGGVLTNVTDICTNGNTLNIKNDDNANTQMTVCTGNLQNYVCTRASDSGYTKCGTVNINQYGVGIYYCDGTIPNRYQDISLCNTGTCFKSETMWVFNTLNCAGHGLARYANDYTALMTHPRQIPDLAYVTGKTSTSGIQTASNGLTKTGTNVTLGGTLSTDTIINLNNGNCFQLCDTGNNTLYNFDLTGVTLNSRNSKLQIGNTGADYRLTHCSGRLVDLNSSGLTYGGDYSTCFKPNTLVTKAYVDAASGGILANNGLTRAGSYISLGGNLTGDTTISSASHDNCLLITSPFCASDVHSFTFHNDPAITGTVEGRLYYQNCQLNFDREVSGVTLQIGEEQVIRVENVTGDIIPNGAVVYVNGASLSSGLPTIGLADNTDFTKATQTVGIATHDIANNGEGYITTMGNVKDVDTNGFTVGSLLWLGTGGTFTNIRPSYPNYSINVGMVEKQGTTDGQIYARILYVPNYTEYGLFTGYTASTLTTLNNKLNTSIFSSYSGITNNRLNAIEPITALAVTGVTNGLTKPTSHTARLGGTLTQATTLSGTQLLTLGDLNGICLSTANTNDVAINAKSNGAIYIKSQSGTVASSSDMTTAVGISIDYNASVPMLVTDNRPIPRGLQYADDYTATYNDRSLVDKYYVDSIATGLNVHAAVVAATTVAGGNINLSGLTTVDGISLSNGDRVLVKNQTNGALNGIYAASASTWSRTEDYNFAPSGEVSNGDLIPVISGDTNHNSQWILVTENPIVSGDTLTFSIFSQQQGIVAGDGINVTTVGTNQEVSVKLSPSNPGLCFDATALELDYNVYRYGLTCSVTTGKVDVNALYGDSIGTKIPVRVDTGGTNNLYVDQACFSYTTAANGLTKNGCNVVLGGTLTGNTTVNGAGGIYDLGFTSLDAFSLGFESATITDNNTEQGLVYAGNYASTFVDNSLVSKYFVNNAITGSTLTYCDGLTKTGKIIQWGGSMSTDRALLRGNTNFCVKSTGIDVIADCGCILTTPSAINLRTCNTSTSCNTSIGLTNTGTMALVANNATQGLTITSPAHGAVYAGDYSANFVDNSLVTKKYVTGLTTTSGIQTANNGLTKVGTNVVLGGTLTGLTEIYSHPDGMYIYSPTAVSYVMIAPEDSFTGGFQVYLEDTGSTASSYLTVLPARSETRYDFDGTNYNLSWVDNSKTCFTNVYDGTTRKLIFGNGEALYYGGNYSNVFTARSIPDVAYVTGLTTTSGIQTANNGLTKVGTNVTLGGTLTGQTIIDTSGFKITNHSTGYNSYNDLNLTDTYANTFFNFYSAHETNNDYWNITGDNVCIDLRHGLDGSNFGEVEVNNGCVILSSCIGGASKKVTLGANALRYNANYSSSFDGNSIPDVNYVTGKTSTSGIQTASNGLTKTGTNVVLGGTLTGNTTINIPYDLVISNWSDPTNYVTFNLSTPFRSCIEHGGQNSGNPYSGLYIYKDDINLYHQNSSSSADSESISLTNTGTNLVSASGITITSCGTVGNKCLMKYYADYSSSMKNPRQIPDLAYVTGLTTTSGIQTASNGLTKVGTNVVLGGTLTGNTDIEIGSNYFSLGDYNTTGSNYRLFHKECTDIYLSGVTGQNEIYQILDGIDNYISLRAYNNIGNQNEIQIYPDIISVGGTGSQGMCYYGDYSSTFTERSIPDVAYVTGKTSTSGVQTASNGLTKTGTNITLGGTLTEGITSLHMSGNTFNVIDTFANYSFTNSDVSLVAGSCQTQLLVDGVNDSISMYTNIGTSATVDGNNDIIEISSAIGSEFVQVSGQDGGYVNISTTDANIYLYTGGTQITGKLLLQTAPSAGSATTDAVLVWNSTDKQIKQVSAANLGEDNNIYAMTVVTSNVTLTTGSTYVQLVNNATSGITVTLPANPINGQVFRIKDAAGSALAYNITIARNGKLIDGAANDGTLNTDGGALELVYNNALGSWFVFSFVN